MGAEIGDSKTYLNWERYRYQRWNCGFGYVASVIHPNKDEADTRPPLAGDTKPDLLYSGNDLLWAISEAESLEELRQAIKKNREMIDEVPEWTNKDKSQKGGRE